MLVYTKLWLLLEKKEMKRTDLLEIMSSATLAKLGKNKPVSSEVLSKICSFLKCQPGDIMENVTEEDINKIGEEVNQKISDMMQTLSIASGMSQETLLDEFERTMPKVLEQWRKGNFNIIDLAKTPSQGEE